jgi:hypothetical protein
MDTKEAALEIAKDAVKAEGDAPAVRVGRLVIHVRSNLRAGRATVTSNCVSRCSQTCTSKCTGKVLVRL